MNKLVGLLIVLTLIICAARADQFQLQKAGTTGGFDFSYVKVSITGDHGFSGMTDKIGRITINGLSKGTHTAEVLDSRGQKKSASFTIDGQPSLKIVYVQ